MSDSDSSSNSDDSEEDDEPEKGKTKTGDKNDDHRDRGRKPGRGAAACCEQQQPCCSKSPRLKGCGSQPFDYPGCGSSSKKDDTATGSRSKDGKNKHENSDGAKSAKKPGTPVADMCMPESSCCCPGRDVLHYQYQRGFVDGFNKSNCLNKEYNERNAEYQYQLGYTTGFNRSNCENQKHTEESNDYYFEAGYNSGYNDSTNDNIIACIEESNK